MNSTLNELKGIFSKYTFMEYSETYQKDLISEVINKEYVKNVFFKSTDYPKIVVTVVLTNGSVFDFYPLTFPTEYISYNEENCDAK